MFNPNNLRCTTKRIIWSNAWHGTWHTVVKKNTLPSLITVSFVCEATEIILRNSRLLLHRKLKDKTEC